MAEFINEGQTGVPCSDYEIDAGTFLGICRSLAQAYWLQKSSPLDIIEEPFDAAGSPINGNFHGSVSNNPLLAVRRRVCSSYVNRG